ncbi:GH15 family glucan-1,4-alpha-glucosidase [Propionibacteriaceae bacterium ES.041]|nr:GH15 family glucan-1,4-alpha-glucosidase [Propionibacteriaceae bacterium ES.041]
MIGWWDTRRYARPMPGDETQAEDTRRDTGANRTPIADYAVLGDTGTAALVSRDGSLDWLCLPRFDSAACFAALLGTPDNGRWFIGPVEQAETTRRYLDDSFVLETTHRTASGEIQVLDFMPLSDGRADVMRIVRGISGEVRVRHEWVVRPDYGDIRPWVTRRNKGQLSEMVTAIAGPDMLVLRGPELPTAHDGRHVGEHLVRAGQEYAWSTTWVRSWHEIPDALDVEDQLSKTLTISRDWASRFSYTGPWAAQVERSVQVLRLLTHAGTGGIVAAVTTSLPEDFGGERNWDYRFCWLRDAAYTLEALLGTGYLNETELWRGWLLRAVAGDPGDLQIMYAIDGSRDLLERELDHLPGYADSRPVRIGNGAAHQRQSDVLGKVLMALERGRAQGMTESHEAWAMQRALVNDLADHWQEPDNGLWEIRGEPQAFTHSRVMVWVAMDCAIRAAEEFGVPNDAERWREVRDQVREEVLTRGFNTEKNTFTQHYDTTEVDASLLIIPQTGFLPGDDPRVLGTIEAIENDLLRDGLPLRYRTSSGVDGLAGDEYPFLACSFWLVEAYALAGRTDEAYALMERLIGLCNDVGLLSEEYDPQGERMVGNYPQAFSHLTLVNAAVTLDRLQRGLPAVRQTADAVR